MCLHTLAEEYPDDLAEETGITDEIGEDDDIMEEELEEEEGIEDETEGKGEDSKSIAEENLGRAGLPHAGRPRPMASSVVSDEPAYSDSFGTAPPDSGSSGEVRGRDVGRGGVGAASVLSGMTDFEAEHARRIVQLKREVEMKKRQVGRV